MNEQERYSILERLKDVSDDFYQGKENAGIQKMPELVKCLTEVINAVSEEEQAAYYRSIKNLMEAYESKDYMTTADVLIYDISDMI